jgi:hypothetical protein
MRPLVAREAIALAMYGAVVGTAGAGGDAGAQPRFGRQRLSNVIRTALALVNASSDGAKSSSRYFVLRI